MLALLVNSYAPSSKCLVQDNLTLFTVIEYFDFSIIAKRSELLSLFIRFPSFAQYEPTICLIPVTDQIYEQFPKPDFLIFNKAIRSFDFEVGNINFALYFNVSYQYSTLYQLKDYDSWILLLLNISLVQTNEL